MTALPGDFAEITIGDHDRHALQTAMTALLERHHSADAPALLHEAAALGRILPVDLRDRLAEMREPATIAALVIRNGPVGDDEVPPTPDHWRNRPFNGTRPQDFWLTLIGTQLGSPTCWSTIQDGRALVDVLPVKGQEDQQTGHGSAVGLDFHIEDAFHDERCDILTLLTLRNNDDVPTAIATSGGLDLAALDLDTLHEPRYLIHPDPEHLRDGKLADPVPTPVLFGDRKQPAFRIDPAFTRALPGDTTAQHAFDELCAQLSGRLVEVPVPPGDVLLLNNHRTVHGRRPFHARYDGTDRWLRKLTVRYSRPGQRVPTVHRVQPS
ncbi:TauD/TfdA family dioxygenase [Streptomyces sp. NPDC057496]|uniref:TauD/TfdA family dioxygenase n=1 Tax=Streptomyces sp. NPDC057496 TaxID=3346149 RepID=UPI00368752D2